MARRKTTPRKAPKANADEVRIKLLAPDIPEGKFEEIVRVPGKRADQLIASKQARLAHRDDFSFAG